MATRGQRQPFYVEVANKLIEQLEKGTAPWQKPWKAGELGTRQMPMNPTTGKRYRGINAISLMMTGSDDNRWMTYNQAQKMGAQVMKGAKGMPVQYWQFTEEQTVKDESGKPVLDGQGKPKKQTVNLDRPRVFFATVFNGSQIDGLPPLPPIEAVKVGWNPSERAEAILKNSGAEIHHDQSNRAFYRPSSDAIHLPFKENFETAEKYYATALHELGHWTGHESRLSRDLSHPFGSEGYAKEELRAEISSMIIGMEVGIGHDPGQHAAYVKSWVKALKDDPKEILRASADAEKIHTFVMAFEQKLEQEQQESQTLAAKVKSQLNVTVPEEWQGQTSVEGLVYEDDKQDHVISAATAGREPEFWGVYAHSPDGLSVWVADFNDVEQANRLKTDLDAMHQAHRNPVLRTEQQESVQMNNEESEKIYLDVSYEEHHEAKAAGAKWDRNAQWDGKKGHWFYMSDQDKALFEKWTVVEKPEQIQEADSPKERIYLEVTYPQKDQAKAAGAKWDKNYEKTNGQKGCWYVDSDIDISKVKQWLPSNNGLSQAPPKRPEDEFRDFLLSCGFDTNSRGSGKHPIPYEPGDDKQFQRVKHIEDKSGKFSLGYKLYLDKKPTGIVQNHRTGETFVWGYKGYSLTRQQEAEFEAKKAEKIQGRDEEEAKAFEKVASDVAKTLKSSADADSHNSYLERKEINVHLGLKKNVSGYLLVYAQDVNDKVWTVQTIYPDGNKLFKKNGKKAGNFHVIGSEPGEGSKALSKADVIIFVEGYATGASIKEHLPENLAAKKTEVVVTFDSTNLVDVCSEIAGKFPNATKLVAGDDDRHLPLKEVPLPNTGRVKAEKAAKNINGTTIFPEFSSKIPLEKMREFTDFNDLARLPNGSELLQRSLRKGIEKAVSITRADQEPLEQTQKKRIAM